MARPRPAAVVLSLSLALLGGSLTAIALAGPGTSVENVGSRPSSESESQAAGTASRETEKEAATEEKKERRDRGDNRRSTTASAGKQDNPEKSKTLVAKPSTRTPATAGGRVDATQIPRRDHSLTPTAIRIDTLGVSAQVRSVGLVNSKDVDVPADVATVGWYKHSQLPGTDRGSSVLVGHRDGKGQGPGAFYSLDQLNVGDKIKVATRGNKTLIYTVVARESFNKTNVPLRELFSRSGQHRLTLITCGGPFDPKRLGYTDNIVITAVAQSA